MSIAIPSSLVQNGTGIPGVCTRHGEPVVLHRAVKFISKPPGWSYLLIIIGFLPFIIVTSLLRKEVQATAWPFCAKCVETHKNRMIVGWVLMAALPLSVAIGWNMGEAGVTVIFIALLPFIIGFALANRGSYRLLPWGFTSQDGSTVGFPKAHPGFVDAAQAAYAHAAQQYAAWQAAQQQQQSPYQAPYSQ
ncbi:hypothetical protein Q0Z83_021710 [Actinoplanes sichuanensis]|uniref:Uncharacterized protein n=1 Tax=Actinoplanes sichuanensis TaxID=512349 RepID=A0ABW4AI91_9ACTN|nr:hypothetical protein [Actinoplanes sichuanensis]BEL03980.1 hypothetical protein Q0Z83_021710 [Actinoplanes sichuanensis]